MGKIRLILAIIAAGLIISGGWYISYLRKEKSRYKRNYEVSRKNNKNLKDGIAYEKTRNDQLMVRIGALELSNSEIRRENGAIRDNLKNMNVALRKLESYSATNTETTYKIETTLKDSIIRDTVEIQVLNYHTKWLDLQGYKVSDKFNLTIESRDSLIQVVYWERNKILGFLPLGRKHYSQKITSANPHSKIKYSELIVPRKK